MKKNLEKSKGLFMKFGGGRTQPTPMEVAIMGLIMQVVILSE